MGILTDGSIALVTGAASGIGRATALAFAREGAKVVIADLNVAGGTETVDIIHSHKGNAIFIKADVSIASDVESLFNTIIKDFGKLNFAHNNAGITIQGDLMADYTEANWDQVIAVNLKGVWLCMKYEIRAMIKQGGGSIVNTSSILGLVGGPRQSAYVASKHGVIGLTRAAAVEYGKDSIRVNAVCPGPVNTPKIEQRMKADPNYATAAISRLAKLPLGSFISPEDVAEAVIWLCSNASSKVTGLIMPVDGGYTTL